MDARQQNSWWVGTQPSDGLLQGIPSVPLSQYAKILLPMTAVFLLGFFLEHRGESGTERARLLAHEAAVIESGVQRVERGLEIATGDLFFVVDLVAEAIEDATPEHLAALERSTLAFLQHRPSYFQIRFIDAAGQETLRVERTPAGSRAAAKNELQNKSQRSYFSATMRLEPGEVFVSPLELNVERGAVEQPFKPVVRLATPISNSAGQRQGIVIVNAHGGHFIDAFQQDSDGTDVQHMVINSEGYWVRHRSEAEWGMVPERGRSFQTTFPDVWTQVQTRSHGWAETGEGLFYFDTVTPPAVASNPDGEAHELPSWIYLSFIPRRLLNDISVQIATSLLVLATPLYFALLAVGSLTASALHRRKLAEEALRNLEELKRVMMTAALDAIVVMDENGITLEFNPSAQRIFGYTLEEVQGKLVADLIIPPSYRETHRLGLERYLETGEGRIIDKHVDEIKGIRKSGEEFPVELTICPISVAGKQFFYGFLRDLSESGRREVQADLTAS